MTEYTPIHHEALSDCARIEFAHKVDSPSETDFNGRVQRARDVMVCQGCEHKNISHGYGEAATVTFPEGSRIGLGACGISECRCRLFAADV